MKQGPLITLLAAWAQAVFADVADFEAMDVSAPPRGWTLAKTDGGDTPRWEIVSDAGSPAGAKVLAQLSADRTSGRFPLAIHPGPALRDGTIAVRFKPVSGRVDQAAGLVWRYRDENNYYVVRANALEDNVVLYKVESGRRSSLGTVGRPDDYGVNHPVPAGKWSTLAVVFVGNRFSVSFDGQPLFEVVDATFAEAGRVGVWTKADSVTYFDGFEVEAR
jgi:hypothetical protein